jgi:8-oxo-dGTP pyrophosphatase MutT (NUDIX family)
VEAHAALAALTGAGAGETSPLAPEEDAAVHRLLGEAAPFSRDLELHLTGSGLVVHRASAAVLLRFHPRVGAWIQLGGHGDPGETDPFAVALRESVEECGLADLRRADGLGVLPDQVALVEVGAAGNEGAHHHLDLRYLLETERPDEVLAEAPDAPLRWVAIDDAPRVCGEPNLLPMFDAAARWLRADAP